MGTYLFLHLINATSRKANKFNMLWQAYASDLLLEKEKQNYYNTEMGPILNFFTSEDLTDWAEDELQKNMARKVEDFPFIKIKKPLPSLVIQKRKGLRELHPYLTKYGRTYIKLSGAHYCYHLLDRILSFIRKYPNDIQTADVPALIEYIQYREIVATSAYCTICKRIAKKLNISLPMHKPPKGTMDKIDKYIEKTIRRLQ